MEKIPRIYNPVQKDYATFLKTSEETQGELTLLEVELAPHGGNALHFHETFSEGFEVLEGELNVQVGDEHLVLHAGEKAVVQPYTNHRFFSTSDQPTRFLCEVRPGNPGFEQSLRIAYGLAVDGQVDSKSRPKDLLTLAYVVSISGTRISGVAKLLIPLFSGLAVLARSRGVDRRLAERYLRAF